MKMKPEHFAALSAILTDALQRNPNASEQYAKAGLSDTRLMWRILAEYRKGVTK